MTLRYVAGTYRVSETALILRLGLGSDIDPTTPLKSIAQGRGLSPFQYVQQIQEALSDLRRVSPGPLAETVTSPGPLDDRFLAALLIYGYPVLGLTLLVGAVGVPLPSSLSVVVAGSLAAQGHMSGLGASAVAVTGSVLGDLLGYGLGHILGREFLERRGRWIGFTLARRVRVESLLQRWGLLSVVVSRSLLSFLSSAVNLLAGASRYPLRLFLPSDFLGRLIWTSAYLALGYSSGVVVEAASNFLSGLGGLLISLLVLAALGFMIRRNHGSLLSAA